MSHPVNSELEERAYEIGYDEGYIDCWKEIEFKLDELFKILPKISKEDLKDICESMKVAK